MRVPLPSQSGVGRGLFVLCGLVLVVSLVAPAATAATTATGATPEPEPRPVDAAPAQVGITDAPGDRIAGGGAGAGASAAATRGSEATAAALAANDTRSAVLDVEQPHYISSEVTTISGNTTTYQVAGPHQELRLVNANDSAVVNFGVDQPGATLNYDKTTGQYVLETGGQNGTFTVYWVVAEQRRVQTPGAGTNVTNETTIRRVRYEAVIQVTQASYVHLSQSKYRDVNEAATNWSRTVDAFAPLSPTGKSVQWKLQEARDLFKFAQNPLAALSGDFTGTLILLTFTNGGRLVLLLFIAFNLATAGRWAIKYRREKRDKPDVGEIQAERDQLEARKREKALVEHTAHDVGFDGRTAEKLQELLGDNLRAITTKTRRLVGWTRIKRIYLQAMGYQGWQAFKRERTLASGETTTDVAFVPPNQSTTRAATDTDADDLATDGGDTDADQSDTGDGADKANETGDAPETTASPSPVMDPAENDAWEGVDLANPDERIVELVDEEAIQWSALTDEVPIEALDVPLRSEPDMPDLVTELDADVPEDIESRQRMGKALAEIFSHVLSEPYTDDSGSVRPQQSVLNTLHEVATSTGEKFDVAEMRRYRDVFLFAAQHLDGDRALRAEGQRVGPSPTDRPDADPAERYSSRSGGGSGTAGGTGGTGSGGPGGPGGGGGPTGGPTDD